MSVASLGFDGAQDTARTLPLGDDPAWPSLDQGQESAVTAGEVVADVHTWSPRLSLSLLENTPTYHWVSWSI